MSNVPALKDTKELAQVYIESGLFNDVKDLAQAVVKIHAGAELGLAPITSMREVHIVKNRVTLSAVAMAGLAKKAGYEYGIPKHTAEGCQVVFYKDGNQIGQSTFTIDDAKRAGLSNKDNWKNYPRSMVFARAMSNAVRWFAPDAIGCGAIYTPDELYEGAEGPTSKTETLNALIDGDTNGTNPLEQGGEWPTIKDESGEPIEVDVKVDPPKKKDKEEEQAVMFDALDAITNESENTKEKDAPAA